MNRIIFLSVLVLFASVGVSVFAADVPADGGTGGAQEPADTGSQSTPAEIKPETQTVETQTGGAPVAELATTSASGATEPRPTPAEPLKPAPSVLPPPVSEAEVATEPAVVSDIPTESGMAPWVWLLGLISIAGGGIYGAYSFMKADQGTKANEGSANTCDAIQKNLTEREYELSLVEHELAFHQEALRLLEEKAKEKVEAEKNKVLKKVEGMAKDSLLGKKGESDARAVYDTAEKALDTYEDIQKKIEKTKEILAMLRGKGDGLRAEAQTLNASYVACVANLPDTAKALATGGIKLAAPGVRPVRAIIFDWAGVMATEAYWIWVRKHVTDIAPLMSVDQKVDSGEMAHDDFVALIARVSGKTPEEVWAGVKSEMILNHELIALIRELKKKYKIGLLSNFTAPWLREVLDEHKLWDLYDEHIISSEHKLVKPDSKIYKKILSMLDVEAGEVVFADDRQVNIDAAQKVGMQGFVFTDVAQFKKDLKSLGVSVKPEESSVSKE